MGTLNLLTNGTIQADNYQLATGQNLGKCYAWVNFNGTGTVIIRKSLNVSSVTKNGTGDYTVNFINNLPDANYGVTFLGSGINGAGSTSGIIGFEALNTGPTVIRTVSFFRLLVSNTSFGVNDGFSISLQFFD